MTVEAAGPTKKLAEPARARGRARVPEPEERSVAFALGGLGGSNAHGAGFLQAARDTGLSPKLITCTSGMIHWAEAFLAGKPIDELLRKQVDSMPRLPEPFSHLSGLKLAFAGMDGVFRPAFQEALAAWRGPLPSSRDEFFNLMFPARTMVPTRPPEFFEEIAHTFNTSEVGVVFNSYSPSTGTEYLHINEAARELLGAEFSKDYGHKRFMPITPAYVEAALWLLQYGFTKTFEGEHLIDGAYRRQFIVREITCVDAIFVPVPISRSWQGQLPANQFELEDFKIEMLFTGSYNGELSAIKSINYFLRHGMVSPEVFKPIDVVEVEIGVKRGFFDYFFESLEVFDDAVARSSELIRGWRSGAVSVEDTLEAVIQAVADD